MVESTNVIAGGSNALQYVVDVTAITIGIVAIVLVARLNRSLGGRVNQALRFFVLGVLANVLAVGWSIFFGHTVILMGYTISIHQNLMTLAMIFFILSTWSFSKLVQNV